MKSPKSYHTGDPLTVVLISYPGKDTRLPKTHGNLNGTYNTPNNTPGVQTAQKPLKETGLHGANLCVLEPPFFALSKIAWCKPLRFRAAFCYSSFSSLFRLTFLSYSLSTYLER